MSGNSADAFGGAIINVGTLTMLSSTLSGNSASSGGGIFNGDSGPIVGSASIAASIVAGNAGGDCSGVGAAVSNGYNLVGADCSFAAAGDETVDDTMSAIGIGPLANNGGPTRTMALFPDQPGGGRDPGRDRLGGRHHRPVPDPGSADQRGVARPQGSSCDVGAFELIPST